MASINPYLNFNGTAEEALNFYRSVFGGQFITLQRYKDIPNQKELSETDKEKILHISLPIGDNNILMACDALAAMGHPLTIGNNFSISINADSEEEANRLFKGLSVGGQITMPLEKTFWNAYFGMLTDKFGINWMVNHDYTHKK